MGFDHRKTFGKWWAHESLWWFSMGFYRIYPLVNIQKMMENHHVQWTNQVFSMAMFHSYVDLPEGTWLFLWDYTFYKWSLSIPGALPVVSLFCKVMI